MALRSECDLQPAIAALPGAGETLAAIAQGPDEVYLVGGAVRDLLRGAAPVDLDLVVVGDVAAVAARLGADARGHERFGTVTVRRADGARVDLARARRETYAAPGALPEVAPAGIDEDLLRRDFTVNALAFGLVGPRRGELLSVPHGCDDLAAQRLRVLHPESFHDDPTRLLRLARYAGRLGFEVEGSTRRLVDDAIRDGALESVSGPRLGAEVALLGGDEGAVAGFVALRGLGVDGAIAPGFGLSDADDTLARRALARLPADGDPVALLLGLAARGLAGPRALLDRLGVPARRRDAALAVRRAAELAPALRAARRPSQVDAALRGAVVEAAAVAASDDARAAEWLSAWRHTTLAINGSDLIAAGISPGPAIAVGLRAARAARLDGDAADREAQLAVALHAVGA